MRSMRFLLAFCLMFMLLLSACNGDDNEPLPEAQPRSTVEEPTVVQVITRVITLTPSPTAVPSPTPTLAFDVDPIEGTWTLLINYNITSDEMVGIVHYSASAQITITLSGAVTGSGTFQKFVEYPECPVEVKNAEQPFTLAAEWLPAGDGQNAQLQLTLMPEDRQEIEQFSIRCFQGDTQTDRPMEARILWPALEANNLLTYTFDMSQDFYSDVIEGDNLTGDIYFGR